MKELDVKKIRKNLGITQEELGDMLGVSSRTIINYEQGGVIPKSKMKLLQVIARKNEIDNVLKEPVFKYSSEPRSKYEDLKKINDLLTRNNELLENENKRLRDTLRHTREMLAECRGNTVAENTS